MKKEMTVESALKSFEELELKRDDALENGNSRVANRCYDKVQEIAKFLREAQDLSQLAVFYDHPNLGVRLSAAAFLLPLYEKRSLKVMKEISKHKGIAAFEAEMTIKAWKKGDLKDFYTL